MKTTCITTNFLSPTAARSSTLTTPAPPGAPPHPSMDHRELPARPEPGELRFDALSREWVAVAAHRQTRTHLPPADQCPICPTTPANPSEIPAPDYDVVVFENRFPSLGPGLRPQSPRRRAGAPPRPPSAAAKWSPSRPQHTGSFAELGWRRSRTVIDAWAHRTEALSALPGIQQVFPFENRGADIGVTLHHPHGQIYAYPYVTPRAAVLAAAAGKFYDSVGRHGDAHVLPAPGRTRATAAAWCWRANTSAPTSPSRHAGRWKSTSSRTGRSRTSPP